MTVQDIFNVIDTIAPFSTQEKWDNSGLLVGSPSLPATKALVSLDISVGAVERAVELGCDVIVSHHPVIFSPLKTLPCESPVYALAQNGISAICCHTPLDLAEGGLNDLLAQRLQEVLPVEAIEPLMDDGFGRVLHLKTEMQDADIALAAKTALGCQSVRFLRDKNDGAWTKKLGLCTGSGSSMLEDIVTRCDCLLTGDVKHDRWYKAQELGLGLIDCGHYHTEVIMVPYVAEKLRAALPALKVYEFVEGDPVDYV